MSTASPDTPALRYQKDGAIAWIVTDNPARMNALTASMWQALPAHIQAATDDPDANL